MSPPRLLPAWVTRTLWPGPPPLPTGWVGSWSARRGADLKFSARLFTSLSRQHCFRLVTRSLLLIRLVLSMFLFAICLFSAFCYCFLITGSLITTRDVIRAGILLLDRNIFTFFYRFFLETCLLFSFLKLPDSLAFPWWEINFIINFIERGSV